MKEQPYLITLPNVNSKSGQLSFLQEGTNLPIQIKRAYWIYDVEEDIVRGGHAHANSDRILVCVKGSVEVSLENKTGNKFTFALEDPYKALYFPRLHWIHMAMTARSIVIAFSSCVFEEDVMIKDYADFKRFNLERYV